jgi:hypothetical protein
MTEFEFLTRTTAQVGNSTDSNGAMICEALILGMFPLRFSGMEYVLLVPVNPATPSLYRFRIAFAQKVGNQDYLGREDEAEFYSTKTLHFHNGGPATYWGADPNQPQYRMYEGDRLSYFAEEIHACLDAGWDPNLKILKTIKR